MLKIPVELRYRGKVIQVLALLNTGFETDVPVIALPPHVVRELGIEVSGVREYVAIGRLHGVVLVGNDLVTVVVRKGSESRSCDAYVVVVPGEEDAILSYELIRKLGLVVDFLHEDWWFAT